MDYDDRKKTVESNDRRTRVFIEGESTFSGLQQDIINSEGSEKKQAWSFPYVRYKSLKDYR